MLTDWIADGYIIIVNNITHYIHFCSILYWGDLDVDGWIILG